MGGLLNAVTTTAFRAVGLWICVTYATAGSAVGLLICPIAAAGSTVAPMNCFHAATAPTNCFHAATAFCVATLRICLIRATVASRTVGLLNCFVLDSGTISLWVSPLNCFGFRVSGCMFDPAFLFCSDSH